MADQAPIERALFREDDDGTTVYFPWGLAHRGYRLADAGQRKRASRAASLLVGATLTAGTWTAGALQPLLESDGTGPAAILRTLAAPGAAFLLALVAYWAWTERFVEGLAESDLTVSREQRLREAATLVGPWKVAGIGIAVCGASLLAVCLKPGVWWLAALGGATGVGLLVWSVLIRRAAMAPIGWLRPDGRSENRDPSGGIGPLAARTEPTSSDPRLRGPSSASRHSRPARRNRQGGFRAPP